MTIKLSKALAEFKIDNEKEFDLGSFKVTMRCFTMTDPKVRAAVERVQKRQRRSGGKNKLDLEYDVKMFCSISLVSWTLKDDAGKAVPIDKAPDVFLGTGQTDPEIINAGNELYFTLIEMARDKELFDVDDEATDEEEAKN